MPRWRFSRESFICWVGGGRGVEREREGGRKTGEAEGDTTLVSPEINLSLGYQCRNQLRSQILNSSQKAVMMSLGAGAAAVGRHHCTPPPLPPLPTFSNPPVAIRPQLSVITQLIASRSFDANKLDFFRSAFASQFRLCILPSVHSKGG